MRIIPFFMLLAVFVSCSERKPATKMNIEISLGALNSANFPGGVLLHAKEVNSGELLSFQLTDSDTVEIPYGKWLFYVVGFAGPSVMQNASKCGGGSEHVLDSAEASVTINADFGTCSGAVYTAMISSVGATLAGGGALWDTARWDSSTWGP